MNKPEGANIKMHKVEPDVIRYRLQKSAGYFRVALYRMVPVKTKGLGTFAVDEHWRWYYDEEVPLNPAEQVAALYHELQHLIRGHPTRRGSRDQKVFNIAGDLEINDHFPPPLQPSPHFLYPNTFELPEGQLAEWYYNELPRHHIHQREDATALSPGKGDCATDPKCDSEDVLPDKKNKKAGTVHVPLCGGAAGNPSAGEKEAQEAAGDKLPRGVGSVEAESIRQEVARQVEHAGNVPASLKRWADELLHPQVPWTKLLRTAARRASIIIAGATDQTWTKPPRRELPPFILPKRIARKTVAHFIVDTSGSISGEVLDQAMTEVRAALRTNVATLWVSFVDAKVYSTVKLDNTAEFKRLVPQGGGGTDMRLGFEVSQKLRPRPNLIVVLTDGHTPWPNEAPRGAHTLVVKNGTGTSPEWATTIEVN